MRHFFALAVITFGVPVPAVAQRPSARPPRLPPQLAQAFARFDTATLRSHMAFLADDRLEGRGTGTRGQEIAALYVATQFQGYGLEPAGDSGSYFQWVPFRQITVVPDQCELVLLRD